MGGYRQRGCRWATQGPLRTTSSSRDRLDSGHHSSHRAPCAEGGRAWWGGEESFFIGLGVLLSSNAKTVLNPVLLLESPFLPLGRLIISFTVQLKSTSSQDTEVSPLLFCSYSLVVIDGGGC